MYIKEIYIGSFGALKEKSIELSEGLNIIEGKNEAGKSTVAMFIKFMLYGLSGRGVDKEISERRRYVSWDTGSASGTMTVVTGHGEFKIERELFAFFDISGTSDSVRERVVVTDTATGERVFKDAIPGVALLGVPEKVFMNTVFVKQAGGKIDGDGLAEAIENILLSGDESLSTKKAADRLDKSRKALRYKRGEGGKIYELDRERARLEAKLSEAREKNAEIIELECSVGDIRKKVDERRKESEYYGAVGDAYEKIKRKRSLDAARQCREMLEETEGEISEFEKYGNIGERVRNIHRLSQEAEKEDVRLRELRRHLSELDRRLPPAMTDSEAVAMRADIKICKSAKNAAVAFRAIGITLIAAGVGAAAVALLPTGLASAVSGYAVLGGGVAVAVLGAVFLTVSLLRSKKYKSMLSEWDVNSIAGMEKAVERLITDSFSREDPQSEFGTAKRALEHAEAQRWSVLTQLREECSVFCSEESDTDTFTEKALDEAELVMKKLEGLRGRRQELAVKYDMISSSLGSADADLIERDAAEAAKSDVGNEASLLDENGAAAVYKNKRFADGVLPGLHQTLTDRESRLSALRASTADPAALADELDGVIRERETLCRRYDALVAALDALQTAGENLRRSLMPRIVSEAGAIMGNFTDGKYKRLGVDRGFDMSFEDGTHTRDASYLSGGTLDMAYLSLRGALLNVLFSDDAPPTVYDESFAQIDEERLARILALLSASGNSVQSLVFSCRKLEGDLSRRLDGVNIISL